MRTATLSTLLAIVLLAAPAWSKDKPGPKPDANAEKAESVVIESEDGKVKITQTVRSEGEVVRKPMVLKADRVRINRAKPSILTAEGAQWPKQGSGWLGVKLSDLPAALAAHLNLKSRAVMVRNIVRDSPADKAGLDRYDVIVAIDKDEPIEGLGQFVSRIRALRPGKKVSLWIIHKGKKKQLAVTLGKPVAPDKAEYVYEDEADEVREDQFKLHRGMLKKGPHGWIFQGPKGGVSLPPEIWKIMPKDPFGDVHVHVGTVEGSGRTKSYKIQKMMDGKTTEIEIDEKGGIVVRKTTEAGGDKKTVTHRYKDAEELKKKDVEAYELYEGVMASTDDATVRSGVISSKLGPHEQAARKALEEARKQVERLTEKARDEARHVRVHVAKALSGEARRSFDVSETGQIKVEIREGEDAAKFVFTDEAEMKKKAPKLYKHYEKLLRGDE